MKEKDRSSDLSPWRHLVSYTLHRGKRGKKETTGTEFRSGSVLGREGVVDVLMVGVPVGVESLLG